MNKVELVNPQTIPAEITPSQSLDAKAFDMTVPSQVMVAMMHLTFSKIKCIASETVANVYGNGETVDSRVAEKIGTRAIRNNNIMTSGLATGDVIYRSLYRQGLLKKTNPEPSFASHFKADPQDMTFLKQVAQIGQAYFEAAEQRGQKESLYHVFQLANQGGPNVSFAFLQPLIRAHILLDLLQQSDQPMNMHQLTSSLAGLNKPMAVSEALVDLHKHGAISIDEDMHVSLTDDLGIYIAMDYLQPLLETTATYCEQKKVADVTRRTSVE